MWEKILTGVMIVSGIVMLRNLWRYSGNEHEVIYDDFKAHWLGEYGKVETEERVDYWSGP